MPQVHAVINCVTTLPSEQEEFQLPKLPSEVQILLHSVLLPKEEVAGLGPRVVAHAVAGHQRAAPVGVVHLMAVHLMDRSHLMASI